MASTAQPSDAVIALDPQVWRFPPTRFMGSKERLLPSLWAQIGRFRPRSALDLCSGSGVVSYMLKAQGCRVVSNDYMAMASTISRALITNNSTTLPASVATDISENSDDGDGLVQRTYGDLYYDANDTAFIDRARTAILHLPHAERDIAMMALIRACLKKRPRGIFTYTGSRYNDGRRDLQLTLRQHFLDAVSKINDAVFSNGLTNEVTRQDIASAPPAVDVDLVYLDPPYFSPLSDNEYVRRYHFVEALACNWEGVEIQHETKTRKIKNYPTPFRSEAGAAGAFEALADFYKGLPILISYSSNARPSAEETVKLLRKHRSRAEVVEIDHLYSFGNQGHLVGGARNRVKELIFVAY